MIHEATGIQYEIMTVQNEDGDYIPSFSKLIAEAPNEAIAHQWKRCENRIEETKGKTFSFGGFAFQLVVCVQQKCGHYEILQHPYNAEYEDLNDVLQDFAKEGQYRRCTRCICG